MVEPVDLLSLIYGRLTYPFGLPSPSGHVSVESLGPSEPVGGSVSGSHRAVPPLVRVGGGGCSRLQPDPPFRACFRSPLGWGRKRGRDRSVRECKQGGHTVPP
ncbi:hypothetical protein JZ751_018878 [Albula glossodonta]|uniref:Uncharacterized protein n=1 Tax=Albula glossodonta TaxID=121402 RepID=A0A8T2N0R0_9TELE|nr:hypothetical protein JZ751_018878 [Albula glossodonta]